MKQKKLKLSTEKKKAWSMFSKFIRMKHADKNGFVTCYTCNNRMHWKDAQAGHGIPGRNNAVLFLEEIVRPQCVGCNVFGRGKYAIFTRKLIEELGLEEYDRVSKLAQEVVKFNALDFRDRYEYYKGKVELLQDK